MNYLHSCMVRQLPNDANERNYRQVCSSPNHNYRPQRSWGKVMFLHVSAILFTGGGVCLSSCWDTLSQTRHPPGPDTSPDQNPPPPKEQTPCGTRPPKAVHGGRYGQQAGGTHPTGMHTCFTIFVQLSDYVKYMTIIYTNLF